MKRYNLYDHEDKDYRINSFEQIGWNDPFPEENIFKSKCERTKVVPKDKPNELVFSKSRFLPNTSPWCIFIPRPEMMFKIMRACICVDNANELWLNKNNTKLEENDI